MGFGDWVKDKVDDAGEFLEDGVDKGQELLGSVVDSGAHGLGDLLDTVGADGAADWVEARGDDFADAMGADVAEQELGQTDDPKQLVHGEAATINETAGHLKTFASSFGSTASGLSRIDVGDWSGTASLGFDSVASVQPGKWRTAADAMTSAADAWTAYASTVTWAQGQARNAITQYDKGKKASDAAVKSYNDKVDAYNAGVTAGKPVEELPDKPGPFTDPGQADMEAAQQTLKTARQQRDEAAQRAQSAIVAATGGAPHEPAFTDRMGADLGDLAQMGQVWNAHVTAGAFKATGELVGFARGLNPTDPYNLRHPAAYVEGLSNTVTGLIHTANHPTEVVSAIIGSGWTTDPAEAFGKLIPTIVGTAATGGGEGAAAVTARLGSRVAVDGVETAATRATVDGIESAAQRGAAGVADDAAATRGASIADDVKPMTSDPVDLATGTVLLEQTDLELPGLLPLVLARKHVSTWRYGVWFGTSWTSTLDERLDLTDDAVLLVGGDGTILTWDRPTLDDGPVLPREGAARTLERTDTGGWTVRDPRSGQVRHYFGRRPDVVPLTAVVDANGHRISIARNALNAPLEVRHTGGYRVLVEIEGTRVVAYRAAHGEDARWNGSVPEGEDAPGTEVVRFEHDERGLLERVVNSSGHALQFFHDEDGRLLRWVDRNDTTYRYEYDEQGRCTATSGTGDALAVTIAYEVHDDGSRATRCTDSLGATTTYHLNALLQVERVVDPLDHTTHQEWDRRDRLVATTDPLGAVTRFEHDDAGRLVRVVRADGSTQEWEYAGPLDRPSRVTLPDGTVWQHEHDDRGNRTRVVDPTGAATAYSYDERGRLTTVTRADGSLTHVTADEAGLVVAVTDPLGGTTTLERDELGRVVATTDATGATTRLAWTPEGWLAARTLPDGSTESWTHDGEGNVVAHTDAAGRTTTRTYGPFDVPVAETTPDGATTHLTHDSELRLVRVTNPQGLTWDYTYDEAGRLVAETDFDGRTLTYAHDAAGQVVRRTNGAQESLHLTFDALGRLVEQRADDGRLSVFAHDALGRVTRATNPDSDVVLERDALGRVVAERVDGRTLTSELDVLGRRVRRTTPSGSVTTWEHDAAGRTFRLDVDGHEIGFDRDAVGREVRRTLGSTVLDQAWDATGLLTGQTLSRVSAAPAGATGSTLADRLGGGAPTTAAPASGPRVIERRTYDYTHGHLTRIGDSRNGVRTFELDLLDRVVGVQGDGWSEAYAYDGTGNLTTSTRSTASGGAGSSGARELRGTLLTRAGDTRFTYDAQGRVVSRTRTRLSRKPETWLFTWDAEDRLTGVRTPDGRRWRYLYDALGRRVAKERLGDDGTVAERVDFTWDGLALAEQTTADEVTTWTHDGTRPLTQSTRRLNPHDQDAVDREFFSIVTDLVGAPTELVDSTGELAWQARRTVWGAPLDPAEACPTPLRFPGQYADAETGLSYNLARYYDPETGRYASQDPLGLAPAPNPNAYVANPNELFDPWGLAPCRPVNASQVDTPYGPALQGDSAAARAAADQVRDGVPVYRAGTLGRSQVAEGQFWAFDHPATPGYASKYGIPEENMSGMDFVEQGRVKPGTDFITREAPGIGDNVGGGIEVVVPPWGVELDWFSALGKDGLR